MGHYATLSEYVFRASDWNCKVYSGDELLVHVWDRHYLPAVPLWDMAPNEYHGISLLS